MRMSRYVIVGAGAVGASIAAELHRAGVETLLVARGAHLAAVREHGLHYLRPGGAERLPIPVAAGPDEVELAAGDVLVFATKTPDTPAALSEWAWRPVKRAAGGAGTAAADLAVVTVQNGLDNERTALRLFAHVLGAVVWLPSTFLLPGEVANYGTPTPGVLWLGRSPTGGGPRAEAVAADLRRAGFTVHLVGDITAYKVAKLIDNLTNALDALYPESHLRAAALAVLQDEARGVLAAAGLRAADHRSGLGGFGLGDIPGKPRGGSSTWQSLARAGTPETDYLNGEIVLLGHLYGVDTPHNAAIQARVHRAVADGTAPGSLDDADLAATLPRLGVLVGAAELHARLGGPGPAPVLLDVRWALGDPHCAEHYHQGHLPGAVYVDLDTELAGPHTPGAGRHPLPSIEDLQAAARRWGVTSDRDVVVYDNTGGLAAARAWWLLRWAGVPGVRLLDGGLAAWLAAGFEQVAGAVRPAPGDVVLSGGHLPTLTAGEAAALPGTGTLLDARAGERYRGEVEPVDPRAGHIPGAVSAPTGDNLRPGLPLFKPAAELRERFAAYADGPVGVYCGSGVTAAHEIAALAVAGIEAALYPGSWSAWSSDPARPAATGDQP